MKSNDDIYKRSMAIRLILEGAKQMGWTVGIPDMEDDEEVTGLIMGTDGFMKEYTEEKGPN